MGNSPASLEQHRQRFPGLARKVYLNFGGQGPMPRLALEAIRQAHETFQTIGPFSQAANSWVSQEIQKTRQAIATELSVPPTSLTLTENVSAGCNIALWGIDWHAGDHVLLSDCEHPSVIATVQELQRRFGIEVSTCPLMQTLNEGNPVEVIQQHLRSRTRLVVISHILWNTGQVLPLQEIVAACQNFSGTEAPIQILVDAAQSVGVLPLNLTELGADFYAFTGHKWWCGPAGLGGLYVRPDVLDRLSPTFIGWRGITKDQQGNPTGWNSGGSRFEVATSDYPLYAGLRAAMTVHQQWGTALERYQRIQSLSQRLWQELQELPQIHCLRSTPPEAGLVSFQLQQYPESIQQHTQLANFLEARQIMVRTILLPYCVRACVHYFTTETEVQQLVAAVSEFVQQSP